MINGVKKFQQTNQCIYAFILLFIISQSLASTAACKMTVNDHDMPTTQKVDSNNPHAGHIMQSMNMEAYSQDSMSDCCDMDCQCAQNTCASANPMLNNSMNSMFNTNQYSLFGDDSKLILPQTFSALFRPPIIC